MKYFFCFSPLFLDGYGNASYWCWIRLDDINPSKRDLLIILVFFLYLWIAIIYNSLLIFLVLRYFRCLENHSLLSKYDQHLKKIIWIPVAMIACWILPSLYRIFQMAGVESFWISWLHAICEGINGFVNTMIYAFNKKLRDEIKLSFTSKFEENF